MTPRTRLIAVLLTALTSAGACHAHGEPPSEPTAVTVEAQPARVLRRPVLRMTEHGSWGTAIQNAGIPTFSLYEDGLLVYAQGEGDDARAMQVRLSPDEVYALVDLANDKLGSLPPQIMASTASDQPEASIGVTHQGHIYSVGVYGFTGEASETVPAAFVELHRALQQYTHPDAEAWQPDELEVVLWRRDDLEGEAASWPSVLPPPPADAREPRPLALGRNAKPVAQPIRYRIAGEHESDVTAALATAGDMKPFAWQGSAWLVRTERVVPEARWYR